MIPNSMIFPNLFRSIPPAFFYNEMTNMNLPTTLTPQTLPSVLADDIKVKVAAVDCDGVLRGKIMSKEKFLSIVSNGFGFSSAIFGWDMHDMLYTTIQPQSQSKSSAATGFADLVAIPDLNSFRRIPWEDNIPFFLLRITDDKNQPVAGDGRSMLKSVTDNLARAGYQALAGVELEFMNFQTPSEDGYGSQGSKHPNLATFLEKNTPQSLRPLTAGMFCYSATRPVANKSYFYDIFDTSAKFNCNIEGWHTESGPGVYEAALKVCNVNEMADRVSLFKFLAKSLGVDHGITPCFMAKPLQNLPGNSGHIHISLTDQSGKNLFGRDDSELATSTNGADDNEWSDIAQLSTCGRQFLAGILDALPDIMPLFAPTINSYKRLVENYWAPVHISWGLEDRIASIRVITPPVCKPSATRFEIRIPGADMHPHYALSVLLAAGLRGIQKGISIRVPPMATYRRDNDFSRLELLPTTLEKALERFSAPNSIAREILDAEFVEFFTATRQHELGVWREAVTDWEFKRYIETV